jgi:hypothetical protein
MPAPSVSSVDPTPPATPLGLTVHDVPLPAPQGEPRQSWFGPRTKLLLVLLVCIAPVIASYMAYYVVRPEGRRNFGQLIDPQRPVPALQATDLAGKSVALPSLKGQWLLVSVASGACDAQCERHLYLQRQLLTSLGKFRDNFDWVWLVSDDQPVREALRPGLQMATVLRLPEAQIQTWLSAAEGQQLADHFYVVDPLGNWMMRFPPKLDAAGASSAKRDLERLLRGSAAWDKAGRLPQGPQP